MVSSIPYVVDTRHAVEILISGAFGEESEEHSIPRALQSAEAEFGQVVAHIPSTGTMNSQIAGVLSALNDLRNKSFGHGMTTQFGLSASEVDFTYLACVGGVLLLTRVLWVHFDS
jgi:hypothetical protein